MCKIKIGGALICVVLLSGCSDDGVSSEKYDQCRANNTEYWNERLTYYKSLEIYNISGVIENANKDTFYKLCIGNLITDSESNEK